MTKTPKKLSTEAQALVTNFKKTHGTRSRRVKKMESIVQLIDIPPIIELNNRLRAFYNKHGTPEITNLLDRMTTLMNQVTEIVHQVRSKRITLEIAEREIRERISEINDVADMMNQWETVGV